MRRGELYGLRDGFEVAGWEEVCAWRKVRERSPRRSEHTGADYQESDPPHDVCCSRGDSRFSCLVVSRSGQAEPASGTVRLSAHRHVRRVLGRGGGYVVEEEGRGAEDRDLRDKGTDHCEACSCFQGRERVQGSERLACFSRRKNRWAATSERGKLGVARRAGRGKKDHPRGSHIS